MSRLSQLLERVRARFRRQPPPLAQRTTKECPLCGNRDLVMFPSMNLKSCTLHHPPVDIAWTRDEGQPALYGSSRQDRKVAPE